MKKRHLISRRDIVRQIGLTAGASFFANQVLANQVLAAGSIATPKQVEGPFYPVSKQVDTDLDLTLVAGRPRPATGEVILVRGRVLDTNGQPLTHATVDIWQANHYGRYDHPNDKNPAPLDPNFQGWGIVKTDAKGVYNFKTISPGAYPLSVFNEGGMRSKHIHFKVSQDGSKSITTQMYFHGDPLIEQDDLIKQASVELRHLLISKSVSDATTGLPLYTFDIVLANA